MIGSSESASYVPIYLNVPVCDMVLSLHRHPHIFSPMLGRGCDEWAETSPDHLVALENAHVNGGLTSFEGCKLF